MLSINKGIRPIQKTRNSDIIRLLRENGANSNIDNNLIIKSIPKIKSADIIKLLIGNGVNANVNAIKLLLENCTDVNTDVIKLLLGSFPNVNAQDNFGNTLLHYANNITVVKMLLFRDANTNVENFEGKTPLDLATGEKYDLLLKCGGKHGNFSKFKAVNSQDSELIDFNNIFHYESSPLEQQRWDEFLKDITTSQQQNNDTKDLVSDDFVIKQSQLVEQQKWDEFLNDIIGQDSK